MNTKQGSHKSLEPWPIQGKPQRKTTSQSTRKNE